MTLLSWDSPVEPIVTESGEDQGLAEVVDWFRRQERMQERFGAAIRRSLYEVLDGQRTGRYRLDDLSKVEKTYVGTKVEILVQAEFRLQSGDLMDYSVAGHEVDAKWSKRLGGWMIPREAVGQLCLCLTASDDDSTFSVGVVRASNHLLRHSRNQDRKRQLNNGGKSAIVWLAERAPLPENLLLHLQATTRERILQHRSGQRRISEMFRLVQARLVNREVVLTVARQDDGPKRVRDARNRLRSEGILILGHQIGHRTIAEALTLPVPSQGTWVSGRVVPTNALDVGVVEIGDSYWQLASEEDPLCPGPATY